MTTLNYQEEIGDVPLDRKSRAIAEEKRTRLKSLMVNLYVFVSGCMDVLACTLVLT